MNTVKIQIDGKLVKAKKNETVLDAAKRAGIRIPTLCYHPELEPYGGCRLCIVEVKGIVNPLTACTLPVWTGMEIKTKSTRLNALRRFTLQLILSEHPQSCLICQKKDECSDYQHCIEKVSITTGCKFCPKNGQCELQAVIEDVGLKELDFAFEYRNQEIERFDPFFDRDYNLCILCGRCTRACQDLRCAYTLDFHHRGPKTLVGTAFGLSHLETGCQFCGACVDVCPTGALSDRFARWQGIPERSSKTTCLFCSIACTLTINTNKGEIINVEPDREPLCVRGRFGTVPLARHPMRANYPLINVNGNLKRFEMQYVLNNAASELVKHKGRIGIIFSPQITREAVDKLVDMALDLKAAIAPSMNVSGYKEFKLNRIESNACFVFVNIDMISNFSPLLMLLRKRSPEAKTIVIDSVDSDFANKADLFIKIKPGTQMQALKELTRSKSRKLLTLDRKTVDDFHSCSKGRKVYLIYDPIDLCGIDPMPGLILLPLLSAPNAGYLKKYDFSDVQAVLGNQNIDCLYVVGRVPFLSREYKSIISQDCFIPDRTINIFLPAAAFIEIGGSVIRYDGKVKMLKQLRPPIGESQSDEEIIDALNKKLQIKPVKVKQVKLHKLRSRNRRPGHDSGNNWYLLVRESGYAYRNSLLSSLHKGFFRIRDDHRIHINPAEASGLSIKEGDKVRVISSDFILDSTIKLSKDVPAKTLLILNSGNYAGLRSQSVRLECIK